MDRRARVIKSGQERRGPVAYWMSRDQRVHDNWALLYAQHLARERRVPLQVVLGLAPAFWEPPGGSMPSCWRDSRKWRRSWKATGSPLLVKGDPGEAIPRCDS